MAVVVTHSKSLVAPDSGVEDKVYGTDYVAADSHVIAGLSAVAASNQYADLSGLPTLGTAASTAHTNYAASTHNITSISHTFGGSSTLFLRADGVFAATPGGAPAWGDITGTVSTQTDLQAELDAKANSTHVHSASDITSSTLALARIAGGTYNVSTFLNGTSTFSQVVYGNISGLPTLGTAASTAATDYAVSAHFHGADKVTTSTFNLARLGSGTYNTSTYLQGTTTFAQPSFSSLANMPTLGTAASTNAADYASSTHNISSVTHTFPGGTTNFLRADGTFAAPPAGASNTSTVKVSSIRSSTTTSTAPLTELAFTVSNTVLQAFQFGVVFATAASTTGLRLGLTLPATSSFAATVEIPQGTVTAGSPTGVMMGYVTTTGASVVSSSVPFASTQYFAQIYGSILPSANGTLQLTYATEVAGSAVSTFAGSYGILTTV